MRGNDGMKFDRLLAVLTLCVHALVDADAKQEPAPPANPMAAFGRMVPGEWRLGAMQTDRWTWGPGQHSISMHTTGFAGGTTPWRELGIYYWHPGRKQVRTLGFHPDIPEVGRGVAVGTIAFDGDAALGTFELHQRNRRGVDRREMGVRFTFDGPDALREVLLEDSGAGLQPLVEWDLVRSTDRTEPPAPAPDDAPDPSPNLRAFLPLLGEWQAVGEHGADRDADIRTTVESMDYLDVVAVRVTAQGAGAEAHHLLDAYLYVDIGSDSLRSLVLTDEGAVYEGGVTLGNDGGLRLDLTGYESDRVLRREITVGIEQDGSLRARAWTNDGPDPALLLDVRHRRTEKPQD